MDLLALVMLAAGLVLMLVTGWASYAVLLAVACAIAAAAVLAGRVDAAMLALLPGRVVGLLEHDLLQAIALYSLVGALARHLQIGEAVMETFEAVLARLRCPVRPRGALAGFAFAAVAAPMNGSVAASLDMLARTAAPRWRRAGLPPATVGAMTAAAGTLGVIVPPSIVMLLFGDAMMRAHTEALAHGAVTGVRVINTQDVVQACAPAALLLAAAWAAVAAWRAQRCPPRADAGDAPGAAAEPDAPARPGAVGWVAPLAVVLLLALVATGRLRAVEASATALLALLAHGATSGGLRGGVLARVLGDAMALTGALFALLLAATTVSLVLRLAGSDVLVAQALVRLQERPMLALLATLAGMLLLSFVLDAYEMVFLVVPVVMPPLLAVVPDAGWVACLALLVLQAGFLLPPWGFAVVLSQAVGGAAGGGLGPRAREIAPYLLALALVAGLVAALPQITTVWRSAPLALPVAPSTDDAEEQLRRMSVPRDDEAPTR